jgi:hypothetical protein
MPHLTAAVPVAPPRIRSADGPALVAGDRQAATDARWAGSHAWRDGRAPRRRRGRRNAGIARVGVAGLLLVVLAASGVPTRAQGRGGAPRFFQGLFARPERPPALIEVPQPPAESEIPALAREALRSGRYPPPKPADPARPPVRLPTWAEAVTFGAALRSTAATVVTDALDPAYEPAARESAPTTVLLQQRGSARPLVVTRLQPSGAPPPRTARFQRLRTLIARTLATYQQRPLNTAQHTPWEVMHGFIAFGIPTQVRVGGPAGELVNAIGWSNMGGRCRGQTMLSVSDERLTALKGFGVQGHSAQYLAILAQCRVAASSPIMVNSREFTVSDLIEEEKLACRERTELTFALIALAHYLPTDASWKARDGQQWSLARLVEEELDQPIRTAPCGGTHRLFGLAYGCQRRLRATGQLDGVYLRAEKYVRDYQQLTLSRLQNRDGSFSTEWFKYPADRDDDLDRKVQTTGHILEWLVASLEQEQLYHPRIVAATEFLAVTLAREPSRSWKIGPLGHALHALNIYQERAWGVVLPGGVAAFHGPMKAVPTLVADRKDPAEEPSTRR